MTGYTVHTGSSEKFSGGWDRIFRKAAARDSATAQTKQAGRTPSKTGAAKRQKKSKSSR